MRSTSFWQRWGMGAVAVVTFTQPLCAQTIPSPVDPDAPMAELPGVEWPDLNIQDPAEPPATSTNVLAGDQRYTLEITGIVSLPATVSTRFNELSVLKEGESKPANAAQLARRGRDDAQLMNTILRAEGYYDANVDTDIGEKNGRLTVTIAVEPGPLYRFDMVEVPGLPTTQSAQIPLKAADPLNADAVRAAETELQAKLMRQGYPFAKVGDPTVTINHETRAGTLALNVDAGPKRNFGGTRITNSDPPFGPKHVQTIARFRPGQPYNQDLVDDLRRALVATGLMSTVRVAPVEGTAPGTVDIATTIEPAPMRTIAGEAGYGTGEGFRIEASWQHRNLIRPEGAVTFRGVVGTKEQSLGALLRANNFRQRDQILNAAIIASHQQLPAYDAISLELAANLERQTSIIWQKKWVYSFGFEVTATREGDFVATVGIAPRRTYFIGALPLTLGYDGSDDLLDPKRGFRLSGRLSPELSVSGKTFGYVRAQIDGSAYYPVNDRFVIAGRARIGSTVGASREDIAPSRRYYAGGGGSVRGFGYQEIGTKNALNQPIGGRSLAEFSLEARVRLPIFGGNFGVVPFVDAGNVYTEPFPDFSGLRVGAGVGLRYYSNFGPIRIDVGTPLGRRRGESLIAVQVSLGQAF